jgi:hypothetical protein
MQRYRARLPVVAAVLLVAATILFVVGTTIERSQARTGEGQEATTVDQSAGEHNEPEATQGRANTTEGTEEHGNAGESGEELFGINPESAGLTAAVAAVSLLLAVLLVARPGKGLLVAVAVIGLMFAALDLREGIHPGQRAQYRTADHRAGHRAAPPRGHGGRRRAAYSQGCGNNHLIHPVSPHPTLCPGRRDQGLEPHAARAGYIARRRVRATDL